MEDIIVHFFMPRSLMTIFVKNAIKPLYLTFVVRNVHGKHSGFTEGGYSSLKSS